MKITYLFPSRSRPSKFFEALNNIRDLSASTFYEIIAVIDNDDISMNNDEVKERLKEYPMVRAFYGLSENKVAACNREISKISSDTAIVCLHSDDMVYLKHGFDNEIRQAFKNRLPDLDGIVHFPDSNAKARVMTYTMMGINLLKKLGYLYHPDFCSVYADNHLTEMVKAMGKYVFVDKPILEHFHPIWGKGIEWDEQYRKSESDEFYQKDRETFIKLRANKFGL